MKRNVNYQSGISPRMTGIYEQHYRAYRFLQLSHLCKKQESKFRYLIAAVYPARAIAELMLESAEKQELQKFKNKDIKKSRMDFEQVLETKLPYYSLLEKIRIHDFHRFGCIPPDPANFKTFIGGPIKLAANKGVAAMVITHKRLKYIQTGNSSIQKQRPLYNENGFFFDEKSEQYISLDEILREYLHAIPKVIAEFKSLCTD
ncbi:MAG: hypothetical protein MUP21_01145 [Dehalococcoidia bacterium]|jgi:hypothetical protein|nr:hypothetical protein [Dehalococcoidia bacterium]